MIASLNQVRLGPEALAVWAHDLAHFILVFIFDFILVHHVRVGHVVRMRLLVLHLVHHVLVFHLVHHVFVGHHVLVGHLVLMGLLVVHHLVVHHFMFRHRVVRIVFILLLLWFFIADNINTGLLSDQFGVGFIWVGGLADRRNDASDKGISEHH